MESQDLQSGVPIVDGCEWLERDGRDRVRCLPKSALDLCALVSRSGVELCAMGFRILHQ